jgi:hypothetical protein
LAQVNAQLTDACGACSEEEFDQIQRHMVQMEFAANLLVGLEKGTVDQIMQEQAEKISQVFLVFSIYGPIESAVQLITGKSTVTGEEVDPWMSALGLIPVVGAVGKAAKAAPASADVITALAKSEHVPKGVIKASETIGQPVQAVINGRKQLLRVDIEPNGKLQIQSGTGKSSIVDSRPDLSLPLGPQIDEYFKRLPQYARDQLKKMLRKAWRGCEKQGICDE